MLFGLFLCVRLSVLPDVGNSHNKDKKIANLENLLHLFSKVLFQSLLLFLSVSKRKIGCFSLLNLIFWLIFNFRNCNFSKYGYFKLTGCFPAKFFSLLQNCRFSYLNLFSILTCANFFFLLIIFFSNFRSPITCLKIRPRPTQVQIWPPSTSKGGGTTDCLDIIFTERFAI